MNWRGLLLLALVAVAAGWLLAPGGLRFGTGKRLAAIGAEPLRTRQGTSVLLTSLAPGKPMVVNLWASWCPPCRREMPLLAKAQLQHVDVTFVFANQGEDALATDDYLATEKLSLSNLLLDTNKAIGQRFGSAALPITLFFDAEGKLLYSHLGGISGDSLNNRLSKLNAPPKAEQ